MLFLSNVVATLNYKKVGYVVSDTCRHLTLLAFLIFYAFLGAGIFFIIERPDQVIENAKRRVHTAERINAFTEHLSAILLNECLTNTSLDEVRLLEKRCGDIIKFELQQEFPEITFEETVWNYWHALIYASTIFTTIGYGHLYCRTRLGQIVTIIYAIFGIPLTMTVLNNIGRFFYNCLRLTYKGGARLAFKIWNACWKKAEHFDHRLSGISHFVELDMDSSPRNLPVTVAVGIMVTYTLSSAGVFLYWEKDWDYFTAVYFMFISLSTIGLGDVIPEHQMYMLASFALILVGLALVSMCISVMQAKLERTYHEAFGSIEQSIENMKIPPNLDSMKPGPPEEKVHQVKHGEAKKKMPPNLGVFQSMDRGGSTESEECDETVSKKIDDGEGAEAAMTPHTNAGNEDTSNEAKPPSSPAKGSVKKDKTESQSPAAEKKSTGKVKFRKDKDG